MCIYSANTSKGTRLAVSYIRVSTQRQGRSGLGLEAQQRDVENMVAMQGMTLIRSFTEIESGAHNDRPQLAAAMDLCRKTGAILIVARLDRLSRNSAFLLQILDGRTEILCCDNPNATRITLGVLALFAEEERSAISVRIKAALQSAKNRGVKLGNPNGAAAFGDRRGAGHEEGSRRKADEFAATVSDMINEYHNQGMTLRAIADALNEQHIKTRRGGTWSANSVKRIIDRTN